MTQSFRQTPSGVAGRTGVPSTNGGQHASRLARPISCRGNILRFHLTPAAMFVAQATGTPQMLRDVDLARSVKGAHDVRACDLPQFPVTFDPKIGTELAAFSDITARGNFARCTLMSSRKRCERSHYQPENPVKSGA